MVVGFEGLAHATHEHASEVFVCYTVESILESARVADKAEIFTVDKHYYDKGPAVQSFLTKIQGNPTNEPISKLWIVYLVKIKNKQTAGIVYFLNEKNCAIGYVEANVGVLDMLFMDMRYDVGEGFPPIVTPDESDELSIDGI